MSNDRVWFTRRNILQAACGSSVAGLAGCVAAPQARPDEPTEITVEAAPDSSDSTATDTPSADHDSSTNESDFFASDPPEEATVALIEDASSGYVFDPLLVRVAVGGTVTWTFDDGAHTVTAYHRENNTPHRVPEESDAWDSGFLDEGESFSHTFAEPGVYDYVCIPHEGMGMVGSVVVGMPDDTEPGLSDVQGDIPAAAQDVLTEVTNIVRAAIGSPEDAESTTDDSSDSTDTETATDTPDEDLDAETESERTPTDTDTDSNELSTRAVVDLVDSANGYVFDPLLVHFAVGGTVRWEFIDGTHTVTAYHESADRPSRVPTGTEFWDSGFLGEGSSFEHRFDEPGVYDYVCLPHENHGMVGSVVVGYPDLDGQPGLEPPQSSIDSEARSELSVLNSEAEQRLRAQSDEESTEPETACDSIDAGRVHLESDIVLRTAETSGPVTVGTEAQIVAWYDGQLLANAPTHIDGEYVGATDRCGRVEFVVPDEDSFRVEIRVDDARGRVEIETRTE